MEMACNRNIWLDGLMGLAVGDALGLPAQFLERNVLKEKPVTEMLPSDLYRMPAGAWSDDTSMAIAMLDSIRTLGYVDPEDVMKRFVRWLWFDEYTPTGETFDEGNTCSAAIKRYMEEQNTETCGKTGEHANGNGSLMRTLPVCLYYAEKVRENASALPDAIVDIHKLSALTHNHLRACMACGLYFFCVYEIIYGEGVLGDRLQKGLDKGFAYYEADIANRVELSYYGRLRDLKEFKSLPENKIKSSGYVVDSLEASIWSLLNTDNYEQCMVVAVNLGDDSDTTAAIAGGVAGLYYGYESIPERWLAVLQRREWLEEMCQME